MYTFKRTFRGPLQLAVLDWAGTTVDYGCCAPAAVFIEGFRRKGVEITMAQAREPMGLEKRAHIETIGRMEPVAAKWRQVHGHAMTAADVDEMYDEFVPLLMGVLADYSTPIPGAVNAIKEMRAMGLKVAGTTGYFQEAMERVSQVAAGYGYVPDFSVCATQVPAGRPAPWMIFRAMEAMSIFPPEAVVKIGDTLPDVTAGLNAGVWTIALARTGNEVGLNESEYNALPEEEQQKRLSAAYSRLTAASAHYTVDGISEVPSVLEAINQRLALGDRP